MSEAACCNLPPVEAEYTPKGQETQFSGFKTYITGPADAKSAVFLIYDIFGLANQTLQGADLIASQGFKVYVPDLLEGKYMQSSWYDGSDEGNQKRKDYFSTFPGSAASQSDNVSKVIAELKAKHEKVGVLGLCWGWKAAVLAKDINKADAVAANHPSFAAKDDSDKVNVPICLHPSKDEDMEVMQALYDAAEKTHPGKNKLKHFPTMGHGWTGARADLKNEEVRKEYRAAYTGVAEFFKTQLA